MRRRFNPPIHWTFLSNAAFRTWSRRLLVSLISFSLVGCATDEQRTVTQGTVIMGTGGLIAGAVIGGSLGLLAGAVSGDSEVMARNAVQGAIIGGGIGAVIGGTRGYQWGKAVVLKKEAYRNSEEWLNASIANTQQARSLADENNTKLRSNLDDLTDQTNQLIARYRAGQASQANIVSQRKKIASGQQTIQVGLANANQEVEVLKEVREEPSLTPAQEAALAAEIQEWRETVAQLKESNKLYEKLNGRLGV